MKKSFPKKLLVKELRSSSRLRMFSLFSIGVLVLLLAILFVWQYSPLLTGGATVDTSSYVQLQKTDVGEPLLPTTALYYSEIEEVSGGTPTGNTRSLYTTRDDSADARVLTKKSGVVGYFFRSQLKFTSKMYTVPTFPKELRAISADNDGGRYKDGTPMSSLPYGFLFIWKAPPENYPAYGRLLGYATTQPTTLPPFTSEALPLFFTEPQRDYGSLEVYSQEYNPAKGWYFVWVVYNEGNVVMKEIQFTLRYHKNMADSTDSRHAITVTSRGALVKSEDSLLFPGEELLSTYQTTGTFGNSATTQKICVPEKGYCDSGYPVTKQAKLLWLTTANTPEVQASMKNDPGDDNYDILAVKHGYVLSDVTGVTPQGHRISIPVKTTSMRDS